MYVTGLVMYVRRIVMYVSRVVCVSMVYVYVVQYDVMFLCKYVINEKSICT